MILNKVLPIIYLKKIYLYISFGAHSLAILYSKIMIDPELPSIARLIIAQYATRGWAWITFTSSKGQDMKDNPLSQTSAAANWLL